MFKPQRSKFEWCFHLFKDYKNRYCGAKIIMQLNKIKQLNGGFETTFKTAVFLFQNGFTEGVLMNS